MISITIDTIIFMKRLLPSSNKRSTRMTVDMTMQPKNNKLMMLYCSSLTVSLMEINKHKNDNNNNNKNSNNNNDDSNIM